MSTLKKRVGHRLMEFGLLVLALLAILPIIGIDSRASALPWYYGGDDTRVIHVAVGDSIQDAIDEAQDGWSIQLAYGSHIVQSNYGLTIYGKSLMFAGDVDSYGTPITSISYSYGTSSDPMLDVRQSAATTIKNLVFSFYGGSGGYGYPGSALQMTGGSQTIENCVLTSSGGTAAVVFTSGYGASLQVINTSILDNNATGLFTSPDYGAVSFYDCLISGNYGYGVVSSGIQISNTTICGNGTIYGKPGFPFQVIGEVIEVGPNNCVLPDCSDCDSCPADFFGTGVVDGSDLNYLLGQWGPCIDPLDCPADFNGNGQVDGADLLELLSAWGPCP